MLGRLFLTLILDHDLWDGPDGLDSFIDHDLWDGPDGLDSFIDHDLWDGPDGPDSFFGTKYFPVCFIKDS